MSIITNSQLVEQFKRFIAENRGYVYGGQGELWSADLANKWTGRKVPSGRNKKTYFTKDCAKWIGHLVDDCSGGIVDAIRQYNPSFGDRTADTFKSQFTHTWPIKSIPEIPGLAVWRKGHIGVYIGNGKAIEFRGTDYGCVETEVSKRDWTHAGMIKGVTYENTDESRDEPIIPQPQPVEGDYVLVIGGSVNTRNKPDTTGAKVRVVYNGDKLPYIAIATSGWYQIGDSEYISNKSDLTTLKKQAPVSARRVLKLTSPYMSGNDVKELQRALMAASCNPGAIDGIFGANTQNALKQFQLKNDLLVTGETYDECLQALNIK